ncbi:MAG: glycosyltransferase family 2 protein [Chloroflexi bacterium]|nr:glycosyltransferase family 2 protein [Chloroflexota bacterium]
MPLVSVVILVWKNTEHVAACLNALQKQTYRDFEVFLVDNGSNQFDALSRIQKKHSDLPIFMEQVEVNVGYAAGNNIGARLAHGHWLALLNDDAFPQPDWLETLIHAAGRHPDFTFFASRQIQNDRPHLLDGAGDAYHITGLAWRRCYNRSTKTYGLTQEEVFSACPAAALYLRADFINAGGFDEDYFSYFEDVDLGFRLRLHGGRCLYVPEAVVHHVGSASTGKRSEFSVYYGYRNMIWTFFKNMPSPYFWLFLPLHISAILFFTAYLTLRGQGRAIWRAVFDALRGLPRQLAKRRQIQKNRKVQPAEIIRTLSSGFLEPYREFVQRNRPS